MNKLRAKRREVRRAKREYVKLVLEGIVVGGFSGLVVSIFRLALSKAEVFRNSLIDFSGQKFLMAILGIIILAFAMFIVYFVIEREPLATGSGIPQVKAELKGKMDQNWLGIIIAKVLGGIFAIGGGLSLGREGPSIQLGAMVGKGVSKISKKLQAHKDILITAGAAAGLSAAFGAPLAGVLFALEELHKKFEEDVLMCALSATVTAECVGANIFGLSPVFAIDCEGALPLNRLWMVVILGVVLGAFGVFYNKAIDVSQNILGKFKPIVSRAILPFVVIIILAIFMPGVLGSGHHLVEETAAGQFSAKALIVLLIVKFLFSVFSFGTGAPGGIFLPLLVLGAVTGGTFTSILSPLVGYTEAYIGFFVIIGMAGYFSAIVRAPITGVVLITEMTGNFMNLLALATVAFVAYGVADYLNGRPVYEQLMDKMLRKAGKLEDDGEQMYF